MLGRLVIGTASMPKKLPYLPLYTGDYLKDPKLSLCTAATRGIWMDALCAMHELGRAGELRGTAEQLARVTRCLPVDFVQAIADLQATNAAEVEARNGVYTLRNRRMYAEAQAKKLGAERQKRFRESNSNAKVTPLYEGEYENEIENAFEKFWQAYPAGRKKSKAVARESFAKAVRRAPAATIIAAAAEYARSEIGRSKWVKMPSTWLNQECWSDDRQSWRLLDSTEATPHGERVYREIASDEFRALAKAEKFVGRPVQDKENSQRWFAQLPDKSYVETYFKTKDPQ